jgi:triosephosphate isomerase
MRKKLIAGNWKMNLDFNQAMTLIAELTDTTMEGSDKDVLIFPPALYTRHAFEFLKNAGSPIQLGVQNIAATTDGAYTGELSASMAKVAGAAHVLVGHSERRAYFNESGAVLLEKTKRALEEGLHVVLCCGEALTERKADEHFTVVQQQLEEVLNSLQAEDWDHITIAYEPVWAIGTGETASPQQAQEMHAFIRNWIRSNHGDARAESVRILYGGSMKPTNAADLLQQADVDGGLIGGASLKAEQFTGIISA